MQERIQVGDTEVVLVGTAHVSAESVAEVEDVIAREEPDRVCVELDEKRYEALTDEAGWKDTDIAGALEDGKGHLLLVNVLLSIYQRRLGEEFDIAPGAEMLAAVEAAEAQGVEVDLIDRDISETMRSALDQLGLIGKAKLGTQILAGLVAGGEVEIEDVEELKERDTLETVVSELGGEYPGLKRAFVDERDAHMAERIRAVDAEKIVAVVGAAHVDGVARRLREGAVEQVSAPRRRIPLRSIASYAVPAVILALFAAVFVTGGVAAGTRAFGVWFGLNAVLAGSGAALARAHPGTVLVSALAAPFTSINPMLPSGLVAAYAENRFDPPTVGDLEAVGRADSYGAFWSNTALNLLLVFFLVNLGSSIASYIGGGYLAQVLA